MLVWTQRTLGISSAVAVQVNGSASVFQCVTLVADAGDQGVDRGERAAADRLAGDDPEPDLDLVQPRAADRGEVERDVRVVRQPGLDLRGVCVDRLSSTTWMSLPA